MGIDINIKVTTRLYHYFAVQTLAEKKLQLKIIIIS